MSSKDKYRLKVNGWKIILETYGSQKKVGVVILIKDKTVFKTKKITKDKKDNKRQRWVLYNE